MTSQSLILRVFVLVLLVAPVCGQAPTQDRAAGLRAQLAELEAQQADLQTRLAQIDEDIKPQNIERGLAGIGSTHPEDLREARRRQLEIQRKGIQNQVDLLASARTRLEASIAAADAETYRRTVGQPGSPAVSQTVKKQSHPSKHQAKKRSSKVTNN